MDSHSIMLIVSILFLVLMSAYFSATETAFSALNRIRMKSMEKNGNKRAGLALRLSENYDKLLSTILIGNNIVNIASASLATVIFTGFFGENGVTLSTVVMTVVVLIFGEISPKSLANDNPEKFSMFSAPILKFFMTILSPLTFVFGAWKKLLSKFFKADHRPGITEEELITIVDEAQIEGGLETHEGELIRSAIEFNDLDVEDILTPRVNVCAVDVNATMEEWKEQFITHGHSRLPVYEGSIDAIIGMVHVKDFYELLLSGSKDIKTIMSNVVCVIPGMKISELLHTLQREKTHLAVVVDEFGGTMGIVTMEDALEELVGEIWDEHDEVIEYFHQNSDNRYTISCDADLDEAFELLHLSFDDEEFDASTVSGWVIQQMGRIPKEGEQFTFENILFTVTKTDTKRVLEVVAEIQEKELVLQ